MNTKISTAGMPGDAQPYVALGAALKEDASYHAAIATGEGFETLPRNYE